MGGCNEEKVLVCDDCSNASAREKVASSKELPDLCGGHWVVSGKRLSNPTINSGNRTVLVRDAEVGQGIDKADPVMRAVTLVVDWRFEPRNIRSCRVIIGIDSSFARVVPSDEDSADNCGTSPAIGNSML